METLPHLHYSSLPRSACFDKGPDVLECFLREIEWRCKRSGDDRMTGTFIKLDRYVCTLPGEASGQSLAVTDIDTIIAGSMNQQGWWRSAVTKLMGWLAARWSSGKTSRKYPDSIGRKS